MNYGKRLKYLIDKSGLDYKQIADKINVTPSNISQLVNKSYPKLEKIEQICKALNIEIWEFFITSDDLAKKFKFPKEYHELTKNFLELDLEDRDEIIDMLNMYIEKMIELKKRWIEDYEQQLAEMADERMYEPLIEP